MRRHVVSASLLLFGAALLAGCGQKGPLFLPKPVAPATPAAPASSVAAPAASLAPAPPQPTAGATSPVPARSG